MAQKKSIETIVQKILIPSYPMITNFTVFNMGTSDEYDRKYTVILEIPIGDYDYKLIENIKKEVKLLLSMLGFSRLDFDEEVTKNHTLIIRTWIY